MGKRKTAGKRDTRNHELVAGVPRHGASWTASASRRWMHSKKGAKGKPTAVTTKRAPATVCLTKAKWYSADDCKTALKSNKAIHKQTKLRASITPGTVLIVLAGRFRGRRVIFLKQLASGLLLVTGPFSVNGVPLRRVNQRYVIATSSKVDTANVTAAAAKINDEFFAKSEEASAAAAKKDFFEKKSEAKAALPAARKAAQSEIDNGLLPAVKALGKEFVAYLGARFSLTNSVRPHAIKF
jgi:large subunit ribosomal protein L6e